MKVVIVGAGPAGLISALNLIQEGIVPVILEKQSMIKSTACGEACDLESLNRVPFDSTQYICKKLKGAKLVYPDGTCSYLNKSSVTLDRTNWLRGMAQEIEARGGQIRLNSEVVAVNENSVQLQNGETIAHQILIGADGPNSLVARYLGIAHQFAVASQYKLICDTSDMDYLEFHIDRRFAPDFSWIFPKDGGINVGVEGDFTRLETFLKYKELNGYKIIDKEAGIIPTSGIHKLVHHNIALIGDSGAMTNPFSGGGLTSIICAAQILGKQISSLENYERRLKKHPIAAPVLSKARHTLLKLPDKDVVNILSFLTEPHCGKAKYASVVRIIKYPSLILKLKALISTYQALRISRTYGW